MGLQKIANKTVRDVELNRVPIVNFKFLTEQFPGEQIRQRKLCLLLQIHG